MFFFFGFGQYLKNLCSGCFYGVCVMINLFLMLLWYIFLILHKVILQNPDNWPKSHTTLWTECYKSMESSCHKIKSLFIWKICFLQLGDARIVSNGWVHYFRKQNTEGCFDLSIVTAMHLINSQRNSLK